MSKRLKYALRMFASRFRKEQRFLDPEVPLARVASHANYMRHLVEIANRPGMRVLEIGSREVTGTSSARANFDQAEYVGFDYYPGPNVDVVGDAHRLSSYFEGQAFDLVYTSACFEHFAMPWRVSTEIAKVMKLGGTVFVETRFSYHEPWSCRMPGGGQTDCGSILRP